MDLDKVSLTNASQVYNYIQRASGISQNYYPERLGKLYIINAHWTFTGVWAVVKGWLDPVTVKKISILGRSYSKELLKQIDAENLPVEFGGTCQCPYDVVEDDEEKTEDNRKKACQRSDAGPWREHWKRSAWWEDTTKKEKAAENLKGTAKDLEVTEEKLKKIFADLDRRPS